ncbi:conserved Plasmodium protein, unknown function [Plasmodium vivax]|nr:unnamed protein product [Plasmodium vivax]CAI7721079.1 conserved Plasmodium protein, unknown function [Plasmodium vivax]SCO73295.1 conserved Plasmodium protein, unknown function [Plasmodium vivax]
MKLCRAVFFLLAACALHLVACRSGGDEGVAVGAVGKAAGKGRGVPTAGKTANGKTTNVGGVASQAPTKKMHRVISEEEGVQDGPNVEASEGDTPNGDAPEELKKVRAELKTAKEELKTAKKEAKQLEEDLQKAKDRALKCEKQKRETLQAAQTAQKNLKECTESGALNLTQCKAQLGDREKHLDVCRENEDKCYAKMKDLGKQHEERVSRKEDEAAQLREKVLRLERALEDMELKLNAHSQSKPQSKPPSTLNENSSAGGGGRHGEGEDSDYLISFPMVRSYFVKVLKIYKTFYIIAFEQTNLAGLLSQVALHKDALVTHLKLYGRLTMERLHDYESFIRESDWVTRLMSLYESSPLSQYAQMMKRKAASFVSTVRRLLLQKVVHPVSRELYPQMIQSMRNKYMSIEWDLFLQKLHNNSEVLVVKLNSINPELQGVISPRLEDQLILLIFFTAVNIIHLYLLFYLLFLLVKLFKRVSICLFVWGFFFVSVAYRCTVFVLTLPIRPCLRKRGNRSRKAYRRHEERTCANPERVSYQQQEIKKMHRGHSVHQRRG